MPDTAPAAAPGAEAPAQAPEAPAHPLQALGDAIAARGRGAILSHEVRHGELTLHVAPASIVEVVGFLKADVA